MTASSGLISNETTAPRAKIRVQNWLINHERINISSIAKATVNMRERDSSVVITMNTCLGKRLEKEINIDTGRALW